MTLSASLQRLLAHAQRLTGLTSSEDILAASCRELMALTSAKASFASCCLPGHAWETGVHIDCSEQYPKPASAAARSALFALHRRLAADTSILTIERGSATAAIFAGLGVEGDAKIFAVPIIHRRKRLWGELVLVGGALDDGVAELAQLATVALENGERLSFARRDQDRLLLLAEATNDALYDWSFDTRDFWWGGGIMKLVGSDADPIEHTPAWKIDRIHPDDVARVRAAFEEARSSKAMTWTAEYKFRRQDGSYLDVCDRGYFLRDVGGRAYRTIGSIQDITPMRALLAREQQARADAEAASRAKDDFLAMLGHELRNPLAPIVTGLDLLRMRLGSTGEREITVLQRQAQNMIRLVDDLLDISRITHGKIQLQKERLELSSVIAVAVETARPLMESRGHVLRLAVPSRGMLIDADRGRLAQAIANLLTNAAKYTEPGGTIEVHANRDGDAIEICVLDNGIGIAAEMLPHVFNMFVQERQALDRSQGGMGLGLCIVRSLVDLHGGSVEAQSAGRGKGSKLTIRIPAARPRPPTDADAITQPITLQVPRGRKIIVVDDNQDAADLLSIALEQLGNTTRVAHDAEAALQVIDEFSPEFAVLDIGLPVIDGYELARLLRNRPGKQIRLIAVTGYGQESDKERAAHAGFDAHLVKPVQIEKLRTVIESLGLPA